VGVGASGEVAGGRVSVYLDDLLQAVLIQIGNIQALAGPYLVDRNVALVWLAATRQRTGPGGSSA
jgi:hypothetical protein